MEKIQVEIMKHIATLSEKRSGWKKELNLVSWNGNNPKYDIREWSPDHESCGKGITLTSQEMSDLLHLNFEDVEAEE